MAHCFEQSVADKIVRGALSDEGLTEALSHAARCPRCRQLLREAGQRDGGAEALSGHALEEVQERLGLWRAARRAPGLPRPLKKGDAIDRYVVIRAVGPSEDGMIYEGYDPDREQRVVIKLLELPVEDPAAVALLASARRLTRLAHPNVLPVLAAGGHAGLTYLVYEFVKGTPLSHHGATEPRAIAALYAQAGRALDAAHQAQVAHGNFSAACCLVDREGRVRVLDFGVAEARLRHLAQVAAEPEEDWPSFGDHLRTEDSFVGFVPSRRAPTAPFESFILAAAPSSLGARQHAAPELLHGAAPSPATDQFSFCAALYQHLSKRSPFSSESISLWLRDVLRGHVAAPPTLPGIPRSLWSALERGLSAAGEARFPRMAHLLARWPGNGPLASRAARTAVALSIGAAAVAGVVVARRSGDGAGGRTCDAAGAKEWRALEARERSVASALGQVAPQAGVRLGAWVADWRRGTDGFCAAPTGARVAPSQALPAGLLPGQRQALARACERRAREDLGEVLQLLSMAPREALERAAAAVEALPSVEQCAAAPHLAAPPAVVTRAEVRRRLGLLREATEIVDGAPEGETLHELSLVRANIALDRGELAEARRSLESAAFGAEAAGEHEASLRVMTQRLALACSPSERALWRGFLQAQVALHPEATPQSQDVQAALASALACEGEVAAAARLTEALARAAEGQLTPASARASKASARLRLVRGDVVGAEAAAQRAASIDAQLYGERHPETLSAQLLVAEARLAGAGWRSAESLIDQVAAAATADASARAEPDAVRAGALRLRGRLLAQRARVEHGEELLAARLQGAERSLEPLRQAVAEYEAALGGAHPLLASAALELADALLEGARFREAEAAYRQTAGILESLGHGGSPQLAHARAGVALSRWGAQPPAEALELVRWGAAPVGGELDATVESWVAGALGRRFAARGEEEQAMAFLRRALGAAESSGSSVAIGEAASELASLAAVRARPEALELLERALSALPATSATRAPIAAALARELWTRDRPRALALIDEAVSGFGADSAASDALLRWTRKAARR